MNLVKLRTRIGLDPGLPPGEIVDVDILPAYAKGWVERGLADPYDPDAAPLQFEPKAEPVAVAPKQIPEDAPRIPIPEIRAGVVITRKNRP